MAARIAACPTAVTWMHTEPPHHATSSDDTCKKTSTFNPIMTNLLKTKKWSIHRWFIRNTDNKNKRWAVPTKSSPTDYEIQHTLVDFFCLTIKFIRNIILYQTIIEIIHFTLSRIHFTLLEHPTSSNWVRLTSSRKVETLHMCWLMIEP